MDAVLYCLWKDRAYDDDDVAAAAAKRSQRVVRGVDCDVNCVRRYDFQSATDLALALVVAQNYLPCACAG